MINPKEPFGHAPIDHNNFPWEVPSATDTHNRSEAELPTREIKLISQEEDIEVQAESILKEALSGGGVDREELAQIEQIDPRGANPELSTADLDVDDEIPVNHSRKIRM